MRAKQLFERAASQYFMHATKVEYIPSILKKGLIPNASNDGNGNYDTLEWLSLEGVYATKQPELIKRYIRAHDIQDEYAICLIAASLNSTLPDEDTINILFRKCYEEICDSYGIDSAYEGVGEYFHTREDDPEWELHPNDLKDEDDFWTKVAEYFHRYASSPGDNRPPDIEMLKDAATEWAATVWNEYDSDPFSWKDLKDKIVRRYPRMGHPDFGQHWSIRLPHAVTFSGRNRIVAVIKVIEDQGEVVYGHIPPEAMDMVGTLCPNLEYESNLDHSRRTV